MPKPKKRKSQEGPARGRRKEESTEKKEEIKEDDKEKKEETKESTDKKTEEVNDEEKVQKVSLHKIPKLNYATINIKVKNV